jgi:hypothetical protein
MPNYRFDQSRALVDELSLIGKEFLKLKNLSIDGLEVTQAIQYYQSEKHLTDPNDRRADNSIRLIAGKPAWVRVYLSSIFGISGVSGTLEVQRRYRGFLWKTVAIINPQPPILSAVPSSLSVEASYTAKRDTLSNTLNFIIPGETMIGKMRLVARVSAGDANDEYGESIEATLRQTLRLAGVMVEYDGPTSMTNSNNLQIPAPTLADLQAMSDEALTLFPVQSTAEYRSAGTLTLTHHLEDTSFPASGCGTGWNALHADVVNARTADGNQPGWIYYGLLPNGVPMGPVGGCGGGGVAVGPVNQPHTLAHEAGHAATLKHAPAGGAPNPDPNYPTYEPYPQASIGEYGLDINNGNIADPQNFRDFMAYGGPSWISLYHYDKLLDQPVLNPVTVGIDFPWWKDKVYEAFRVWPWIRLPDPPPPPFDLELPLFPPFYPKHDVISLIVRVEHNVVAEVRHVARARMQAVLEGERSPFIAYLLSEEGEILADAPLLRLRQQVSGGCASAMDTDGNCTTYVAQAFIPDVGKGASLQIREGEKVAWERAAPKEPAKVEDFSASVVKRGKSAGSVRLNWKVSGAVEELWLRWTTEEDKHDWRALSTSMKGNSALIDPRLLPAGNVLLQLVAHDGFFSDYSETVGVQIPERPPEVSILHPVDGYTYLAGQTLRLRGVTTAPDGATVSPDDAVWSIGKKKIGQGLEVWTSLEPGRYILTLRVKADGGVGEGRVRFRVVEPDEVGTPRKKPKE